MSCAASMARKGLVVLCRPLDISLWQFEAELVLYWAGCGRRGLPVGHEAPRCGVEARRVQPSVV